MQLLYCTQLRGDLRGQSHEVVIEKSLSLGEPAADHMLKFLRHLLLYIHFDPPEQEWPQYLVKPFDQALVVFLAALDHSCQRVGEPFFELTVGLEDVWHEEVHQRPQLHQAILQWGPCQQQTPMAATQRVVQKYNQIWIVIFNFNF